MPTRASSSVGNHRMKHNSEFQEEMVMFNKAFLQVMAEGDAKGVSLPSRFPHIISLRISTGIIPISNIYGK